MCDSDEIEAYISETIVSLSLLCTDDIRAVVDQLMNVWERDATVYIIGNGGSASTASHMMNDLCKFTVVPGLPRMRAIALTDNVPFMTAVGNDIDFADAFVEPLRNLLRPEDLLVAISASGNSPNILRATHYASSIGACVVGLCGSPGGELAVSATYRVLIPATRVGQQEDGHLILNHAIAAALRAKMLAKFGAALPPIVI